MSCIPPWAPLLDSCLKASEKFPTFTFCTVSKNRIPHARTCIARGWLFDDKSTGVMVFTTDSRMQKVEHLNDTDEAYESCFYFPNKRTQIRVSGFAQLLSPNYTPKLYSNLPLSKAITPNGSNRTSPSNSPPPNSTMKILAPLAAAKTNSHPTEEAKHLPRSYYPVLTPSYDYNNEYDSVFPPPTAQEWADEHERLWTLLSPRMKKTFKNPTPRSILDINTRKSLDSISRGVDGSSDEAGKENFVVVLMLVNQVDIVVDEHQGRRTVYTRVQYDEWKEQDVSP